MTDIDRISDRIPEYAKDLNLSTVLSARGAPGLEDR